MRTARISPAVWIVVAGCAGFNRSLLNVDRVRPVASAAIERSVRGIRPHRETGLGNGHPRLERRVRDPLRERLGQSAAEADVFKPAARVTGFGEFRMPANTVPAQGERLRFFLVAVPADRHVGRNDPIILNLLPRGVGSNRWRMGSRRSSPPPPRGPNPPNDRGSPDLRARPWEPRHRPFGSPSPGAASTHGRARTEHARASTGAAADAHARPDSLHRARDCRGNCGSPPSRMYRMSNLRDSTGSAGRPVRTRRDTLRRNPSPSSPHPPA